MTAACERCEEPIDGVAVDLADYDESLGPYDLDCALAVLATMQEVHDARAVRVVPRDCPVRAWVSARDDRERAPPGWVEDPAAWSAAVAAVSPHWDQYQQPWSVVVDSYRVLGGRIR